MAGACTMALDHARGESLGSARSGAAAGTTTKRRSLSLTATTGHTRCECAPEPTVTTGSRKEGGALLMTLEGEGEGAPSSMRRAFCRS